MLREFIAVNRDEIIRRCRAKVALRSTAPASAATIDDGVALFLDQLGEALRAHGSSTDDIRTGAGLHGHDLLTQGLSIDQVVHAYGDLCQSITELALTVHAPIATEDFHTLNRCLDDAIAGAVSEYGRGREPADGDSAHLNRLGFFIHELRNIAGTAVMAFEVLKTGDVGVTGSTGAVLDRSLRRLTNLIGHSMAEVRLTQGVHHPATFLLSGLIEEVAAAAALDAEAKRLTLSVLPVDDGITVEADRQVLAAVLHNLLQNAFKFTQPRSTVVLRVLTDAERVFIEVEDECGGLRTGDRADLFRPFQQWSVDRTGLGLGLAFSRSAIESHGGSISVRNLPNKGCVFVVNLPLRAVVGADGRV